MLNYMLVVWDFGIVPEVLGPYDKESRDSRAKDFLKENKKCKILYMDVSKDVHPIFTKVYCDEGKSLTFAKAS